MMVNIHIERLVLDGLTIPYHQQERFQAAVETELGRLFSTNNLPNVIMQSKAVSHLSTGDIQLNNKKDPTHLGQQIAQAVYEGLSR